jgi:hypothetical protein
MYRPFARAASWSLFFVAVCLPVAYYLGITRHDIRLVIGRVADYGQDTVVLCLVLAGSIGVGGSLVGRLGLRKYIGLDLVFAVGIGLGLMALTILLLGVVGALFDPVLIAVLVAAASASALSPYPKALVVAFLVDWGELRAALRQDGLALLATFATLGAVADAMITHAMVPPFEWDSLAYHLAIPRMYLESHRIMYIPFIVHSNWPFNVEMLYTLVLALGTERTPGLLTVSFLVVGLIALFFTGLRLQNCRIGALAAAIYSGMPVVLRYAGTAQVDVPLAVFGFLAALACYEGWQRDEIGYFVVSGLLAGFEAGSKLTGAETGLYLGVFLAVAPLTTRSLKRRWLSLLAFGGPALLVAVPWYVKSWITTGNPIWPFLPQLFPSRNWDLYGDLVHTTWLKSPGTGTSLRSLLLVPWHLSVGNDFGANIGPLVFAFIPIALTYRKFRGIGGYLTIFGIMATLVWFFETQQTRFLSPALPAFAFVASIGMVRLMETAPLVGRFVAAGALAMWLILRFPLVTDHLTVESSLPYIAGEVSRSGFLGQRVNVFPVFEYANSYLPRDASVLFLIYEDRGFYLERPYFWANPVSQRIIRFEQISTSSELSREISVRGFTYAIVNPTTDWPEAPGGAHVHEIVAGYIAHYLEPVFSANEITLYRILAVPR